MWQTIIPLQVRVIKGNVLYFSRFIPDYRLPVLRALNERLGGRLVICSGNPPDSSSLKDLSTNAQNTVSIRRFELKNRWLGGDRLHWQSFSGALSKFSEASVVLAEESPRSVSLPFLMRAARKRGLATVLWGHFSSNSRKLGSEDIRDQLRMRLAKKADVLLCYTDEIADELRARLNKDSIFVARNTLDTTVLFREHDHLLLKGKTEVRSQIGLADKNTILFVGRLIKEKRVDLVLAVAAQLGSEDVSVVIIGDGPERTNLERKARELDLSVRFTGSIADLEMSAPFIFSSDVLLNPGYLGLSVNHAFSLGVPVVAPRPQLEEARMHSPEWTYLTDGESGSLSETDSVGDLANSCKAVLENQTLYSENASSFARRELSLERMVDGLEDAINHAESTRPGANK